MTQKKRRYGKQKLLSCSYPPSATTVIVFTIVLLCFIPHENLGPIEISKLDLPGIVFQPLIQVHVVMSTEIGGISKHKKIRRNEEFGKLECVRKKFYHRFSLPKCTFMRYSQTYMTPPRYPCISATASAIVTARSIFSSRGISLLGSRGNSVRFTSV